uniref:BACK domain-containing protein n=1 Tax=Homalodisca liturata TaxID=320908 RepID=A0A1B6H785_9HEMI
MLIVPKSANDVFPALLCVANISCPELEPQVTKIVQEETQALLNSKYFLDLDTKSLEFISRQEKLSVTELELWRALVRWAQNKATTNSEKTLRQHLQLILPNVRLLTFSPEDISKEVICTKILESDEVVKLLSAIANNHTLNLPGFCSSYKLRKQPDTVTYHISALTKDYLLRRDICEKKFNLNEFSKSSPSCISSVSIYTTENILIESFGVRRNNISDKLIYELKCTITVYNLDRTLCNELSILEVSAMIAADGNLVNLPLKLKNGQPVILKAKSSYIFELKFNTHHSTYYFLENGYKVNCKKILFHPIVILLNSHSHILEISFRV